MYIDKFKQVCYNVMIMTEFPSDIIAENRFERAGLAVKSIAELNLPNVQYAEAADKSHVPYAVFGDIYEAPFIMPIVAPYSTEIQSPHYLTRLHTTQTALGEDYAVVGIQVYHPKDQKLSPAQKSKISSGDFTPFVDRELAVLEQLGTDQGYQTFKPYGQSMGADTQIELVHSNSFDPNKGVLNILGLGFVEPARTENRHPLRMMQAFASSGGELLKNVIESDSLALMQAWELNPGVTQKDAQKMFDRKLGFGVIRYWLADVLGNWAVTSGFATDTSLKQVEQLIPLGIPMYGERSEDSNVFTPEAYASLEKANSISQSVGRGNLVLVKVRGDHSKADNIREAGKSALRFATGKAA